MADCYRFWQRLGIVLAVAALLPGALAMAEKQKDKGVLPMSVAQAVMAKDVSRAGDQLQPVEPTDRFSTSDKKVVSLVRFEHVLKPHKISWRWYLPDGNLYLESDELPVTPTGKYHKSFSGSHTILMQGERAMLQPGNWKVVVYLDGAVAATNQFTLSAGGGS